MTDSVKKTLSKQERFFILVVDQRSVNMLSRTCKMFDVIGSQMYMIESLEHARKSFPHTDAIYFISPSKQSIKSLIEDYA
jgi:syntaxin-binding protein 1